MKSETISCKVIGDENSMWIQLVPDGSLVLDLDEDTLEEIILNTAQLFRNKGYLCEVDYRAGWLCSAFIWIELPSERHETLVTMEVPEGFAVHKSSTPGRLYITENLPDERI